MAAFLHCRIALFGKGDYISQQPTLCAHRLAVRTAPSHGANRGSIPLGRTIGFPHLYSIGSKLRHPFPRSSSKTSNMTAGTITIAKNIVSPTLNQYMEALPNTHMPHI